MTVFAPLDRERVSQVASGAGARPVPPVRFVSGLRNDSSASHAGLGVDSVGPVTSGASSVPIGSARRVSPVRLISGPRDDCKNRLPEGWGAIGERPPLPQGVATTPSMAARQNSEPFLKTSSLAERTLCKVVAPSHCVVQEQQGNPLSPRVLWNGPNIPPCEQQARAEASLETLSAPGLGCRPLGKLELAILQQEEQIQKRLKDAMAGFGARLDRIEEQLLHPAGSKLQGQGILSPGELQKAPLADARRDVAAAGERHSQASGEEVQRSLCEQKKLFQQMQVQLERLAHDSAALAAQQGRHTRMLSELKGDLSAEASERQRELQSACGRLEQGLQGLRDTIKEEKVAMLVSSLLGPEKKQLENERAARLLDSHRLRADHKELAQRLLGFASKEDVRRELERSAQGVCADVEARLIQFQELLRGLEGDMQAFIARVESHVEGQRQEPQTEPATVTESAMSSGRHEQSCAVALERLQHLRDEVHTLGAQLHDTQQSCSQMSQRLDAVLHQALAARGTVAEERLRTCCSEDSHTSASCAQQELLDFRSSLQQVRAGLEDLRSELRASEHAPPSEVVCGEAAKAMVEEPDARSTDDSEEGQHVAEPHVASGDTNHTWGILPDAPRGARRPLSFFSRTGNLVSAICHV